MRFGKEEYMSCYLALLSLLVFAWQPQVYAQTAKSRAILESQPDKARLEQVLAAWGSMDISQPAAFYAKDADLVFYDITPRKYNNWAEYEKGVIESNKKYTSMTFKLKDDVRFHYQGNLAWTTATVDGDLVKIDGSRVKLDARWTTIWEKRGEKWTIVHDHFSIPPAAPTPNPSTTPMPKKP
jgi:ketosteroid isomerase-like protein